MKQIEKKKEKNSKKILSPTQLFVLFSLSRTNPIKSSSFNLFRVLSLSVLFSLETTPTALFSKALLKVFCSVPQSLLLRFYKLLFSFHETTRESEIYTHTQRRRHATHVATTDDDERTISKSKVGTVLRAL